MSATITAVCAYCTRKFTATDSFAGMSAYACDDVRGRLCCTDCLCRYCGVGHVTAADAVECESLADEGDNFSDWDTWGDFRYADAVGAL